MNTILKIILIVLGFVLVGILTWSPWLRDEEVKSIVQSNKNFQEQHPLGTDQANPEIRITKIPFGRWATTYEGGWFVWFWER